ncbi:MAG TPA: hypothetical protein VFP97_01195 [Chitinophagaceae bacterium]|nr:hypothetical protein [Chitinophagaceae bacterium]
MEVHAHSHTSEPGLHRGRKKWTHYFWEFLMLFLAVFCGFLAEYQLEHKIEKNRERQYMQSMITDLNTDLTNMSLTLDEKETMINVGDSITQTFIHGNHEQQSAKLYYYARNFSTLKNLFLMTDGTLRQLKNSGGLRLIRKSNVVDSLQAYDNIYQQFVVTQQNEIDYLMQYRDMMGKIFDVKVFNGMVKTYPDIMMPEGNPELFGTDKQQVNEFLLKIHLLKRTKLAEIFYLDQLRRKANNLVTLIKKEYRIS